MAIDLKNADGIGGRRVAAGAAVVAGLVAVGAGLFLAKDKGVERPDYNVLASDGAFEIRSYPPMLVAETVVTDAADRKTAVERGFRTLADYIFAKSRPGARIAMTAPVLSDRLHDDASAKDAAENGWRVRFVMPAAYTRDTLPTAPARITIKDMPARRLGAVRFAGQADDWLLQDKETALRAWLSARGETATGTVEYAFYDAPMIPGPLRRNEVFIALS